MTSQRLAGGVAIVTGGVRGIGRAAALALARDGADVAIFDLDSEKSAAVSEIVGAITQLGRKCLYLQVDVTQAKQVDPAIAATVARLGKLTILVNNAGKGRDPVSIENLKEEDWDAVVDLNLKSAYLCCRSAVPHLKQQKNAKIVNLASTAGRGISPFSVVSYAGAKAGVIGFTRQLARELGEFGINVNAIAPGGIMTGRVVERMAEASPDKKRRILEPIPLGRLGKPEEVGSVVAFLASGDASFITGAVIDVNGGKSMM